MFHDIQRRYDTSLRGVPTVGDSLRDVQAGARSGCAPWLVHTGNGAKVLTGGQALPEGTRVAPDLASIVDALLASH